MLFKEHLSWGTFNSGASSGTVATPGKVASSGTVATSVAAATSVAVASSWGGCVLKSSSHGARSTAGLLLGRLPLLGRSALVINT